MSLTIRCQSCKSKDLEVRPGKGPHYAELYCSGCDRHVRWLSQYQSKAFSRHLPDRGIPQPDQLNLLERGGL